MVGTHVPWLIDVMPTASWVQLVFGVSVLFNAMALAHRFRLWRLDLNRVHAENALAGLFGSGVTVGQIAEMTPTAEHRRPEIRASIDAVTERLGVLSERCRRQSLSILVPMGQEMAYRYQETLIADTLDALRTFLARLAG